MTQAYRQLFAGDPAPWFRAACAGQAAPYSFDMAAGRFVAVCFYGEAKAAQGTIAALVACRAAHGPDLLLFGVSSNADDAANPALAAREGLHHFIDADLAIARLYGVAPETGAATQENLRKGWFILDPHLRLLASFPLSPEGEQAAARFIRALPAPAAYPGNADPPVLIVPYVFEPDFCQRLIHLHRSGETQDSAILTEGATLLNHGFKRRQDLRLSDPALVAQTQTRIFRRVVPEIRHAFQFHATRMERLIVACYDAADGGRFGAHRDNSVRDTAHRRFAVSITLNADFTGGNLRFPEYNRRELQPPPGSALVFSCALLHEVTPVTQGRRYACLPFVYDEAAAAARQQK